MASLEPKLEVYQINLNPQKNYGKNFKDFIININEAPDEDENSLYLDLFKKFIEEIDNENFKIDEKKNKAIGAYNTKPEDGQQPSIKCYSHKNIISGLIEGGNYGIKRNTSKVDEKEEKISMDKKSVVLFIHYFLLYTPLNGEKGFLLIQYYQGNKIADVFTSTLADFFSAKGAYNKAVIKRFYPPAIIEQIKGQSELKKMKYTDKQVLNPDDIASIDIGDQEREFTIKVEIDFAKSMEKGKKKLLKDFWGQIKFKGKRLSDFRDKKGVLKVKDKNQQTVFNLDDEEMDIKPVINLLDYIEVDQDNIPSLEQLENFCLNLLETDILPSQEIDNDIQDF